MLSAAGQDYVILELAATEILAFEPNQVPDLLQTPEYASALADADANATGDDQREHAIEVKLARQRIVLGAGSPPAGGGDHRGGAAPGGGRSAGDAGAARRGSPPWPRPAG